MGIVRPDEHAERRIYRFLARRFGARSYLLTDSGTSALALALGAAAREGGGPVALPAYGCFDVATAAMAADVSVMLYDIEPTTLGPDWASLDLALRQGAGTVVISHLYGIPVDPVQARDLADEAGALLIEDAAQGSGGTFEGISLGSFGSLVVLSFGRGKGLTGGSGGALFSCDARGEALVADLRDALNASASGVADVAKVLAMWAFGRPGVYALPASLPFLHLGETLFREPAEPATMSTAAQAMLGRTLDQVPAEEAVRRHRAEALLGALKVTSAFGSVELPKGGEGGYLRLPAIASSVETRAAAEGERARRLGIMPGYPRSLSDLAGFRPRVANASRPLHGAQRLVERLVTLPTHGRLRHRDVERLQAWIEALDA